MKFCSIFVIFSCFCGVKASSQGFGKNSLRKALAGIVVDLSERNRWLMLVAENFTSDASKAAMFATASIPHKSVKWNEKGRNMYEITTSTIVLLNTITSVQIFNEQVTTTSSFSTTHQLIIYFNDATVTDVLKMKEGSFMKDLNVKRLIIHHEYFLIEEENFIRLYTFEFFKPDKCNVAELVEVNRFNRFTRKWHQSSFSIDKFSNFNGCQLSFLFEGGLPEFLPVEVDHKNKAIT